MTKLKRLTPRKEPTQKRSIELRNSILEAATYILKKEGVLAFTTNKVAERAGVNIASLYQYYPNKESLLFHLVELEWLQTSRLIFEILADQTKTHRERLGLFIERFYRTEAEEGPLRAAINNVGLIVEDTHEYRELVSEADRGFVRFLSSALVRKSPAEVKRISSFIQSTIFGFSEGKDLEGWDYEADARRMTEMICQYFRIN